ncbi:hypothetical protein D9M69_591100 [compost metagenome]
MGLQVLHLHAGAEGAEATQRAQYADAVFQVHQAQQREGKARIGEQAHLQREGEDMWISRRQQALVGEAADRPVASQVAGVDAYRAAHAQLGQGLAARAAAHGGAGEQAG